jgi:hypothetical protein
MSSLLASGVKIEGPLLQSNICSLNLALCKLSETPRTALLVPFLLDKALKRQAFSRELG